MSVLNEATQRQNQAADPTASTWLSANAGSGKTRVLTDRVARLLLDDVDPKNILCLTYTKAAASEMQNRLFKRLGEWSMMPDGPLTKALLALGVHLPGADLARARRLFARAIETPGGLRIQTIHSFCASLLRRFPLEAGITPRFTEMDDRAAALLRDEVVETMAAGDGRDVVDGIAAYLSGDDLQDLTRAVMQHREVLARPVREAEVWKRFDLREGFGKADVLRETFAPGDAQLLRDVIAILHGSASKSDQAALAKILAIDLSHLDEVAIQTLAGIFLFGLSASNPLAAKIGSFPTKASQKALGGHLDQLNDLMQRIETGMEAYKRLCSAQKTLALHLFAAPFLAAMEARKQARGWLDFDDLIQKASALLGNEAVAGWVLYRLDGGLDHILVDEAQDTSPAQWKVIERLAQEFTSGLGARDGVPRSIFVVGDKKQSIYSFQGADPGEFDRMRAHFDARLGAIGVPLRPMELEYSFRSSQAILRVVDQVITNADVTHLTSDTRHRAFRADLPGRVDVWAAVLKTEKPEKPRWFDPVDIISENHHDVVLARHIADEIKRMIETETVQAEKGARRPITAGDILILVRRRSRLFEEIIRACKACDLPVAGADRLKLGGELAVKDLSALLSFVATPEDSLSLAAALRSPLFGWSEGQLYDLAAGRADNFLWTTLRGRADDHGETVTILQDLLANSDYLRPYDLIELILTRHDGRRRLLARLGPEAEDGIDALLTQALNFERVEVPSLTGFLVWMETDDVEVKRQMDSAGDQVRVMTVHGAKGLEAPVVILPDTAKRTTVIRDQIVPLEGGALAWKPPADMQPQSVRSALSRLKEAQIEEEMRLLYVAMTRAETWLIAAAAGELGKDGDSWYSRLSDAVEDIGGADLATPSGAGLRFEFGAWDSGDMDAPKPPAKLAADLPEWAQSRADAPGPAAPMLSPSDLGGAKALYLDGVPLDSEAAMRAGRQAHRLLEHLPGASPAMWDDLSVALLATSPDSASAAEALGLLSSLRPVLEAGDLAFLFDDGALAEVGITADIPDLSGTRISGTIDRLIVSPDKVLAVDFKTNAVVPGSPQDVPEGILRQIGAYLVALSQIYPDRSIEVAILWTQSARLMPLPHDIVMAALQRTATS